MKVSVTPDDIERARSALRASAHAITEIEFEKWVMAVAEGIAEARKRRRITRPEK
jgi:hypothetical protein